LKRLPAKSKCGNFLLLFQLQVLALDISQYHHTTRNEHESYEDSNHKIQCHHF
jgi:hypothetical protein